MGLFDGASRLIEGGGFPGTLLFLFENLSVLNGHRGLVGKLVEDVDQIS